MTMLKAKLIVIASFAAILMQSPAQAASCYDSDTTAYQSLLHCTTGSHYVSGTGYSTLYRVFAESKAVWSNGTKTSLPGKVYVRKNGNRIYNATFSGSYGGLFTNASAGNYSAEVWEQNFYSYPNGATKIEVKGEVL